MTIARCLCVKCSEQRRHPDQISEWADFRYACELCGNKRCPHHSDHRLKCTGSNERGQEGSVYQ